MRLTRMGMVAAATGLAVMAAFGGTDSPSVGAEPRNLEKLVPDAAKWRAEHAKALKEFQSWKFGLFWHFGPASAGLGKVQDPTVGARPFNPQKFDADRLVEAAQNAGARYAIFTTQHQGHFAMWDTKATKGGQPIHDITDTPVKRDLFAELLAAANRKGFPIVAYYADAPVHVGAVKFTMEETKAQVRELADYPHRGWWFDSHWSLRTGDPDFVDKLRASRPDRIMGRREEFGTPENSWGGFSRSAWERCQCYYGSWYCGNRPPGSIPLQPGVMILVRTAGNGGNLALAVAPTGDGDFSPGHREFLAAIGAWLKANGESIYGTEGGPYYARQAVENKDLLTWGACTCKGNKVYLHLMPPWSEAEEKKAGVPYREDRWPLHGVGWDGQPLTLPVLPDRKIVNSYVLGKPDGKLDVTMDEKTLRVAVPAALRDPLDTIVVLELDGDAVAIEPIDLGAHGWK